MFSWTRRSDHILSLAVFGGLVAYVATRMVGSVEATSPSFGAVAWRFLFLLGGLCGLGVLFHVVLRCKARLSGAAAGTLVLAYGAADAYFGVLFQRHLTASDAWQGWDSIRTGAIPIRAEQFGYLAALVPAVAAGLWFLLAGLSWLPSVIKLERLGLRCLLAALAGMFLVSALRDLVLLPQSTLHRVLSTHASPWTEAPSTSLSVSVFRPGALYQDQLPLLERLNQGPLFDLVARTTPDILFVHVESLRHDYWNERLFPQTLPTATGCFHAPRHYSTGNTTGNALFGALTGLSPGYFDLVRKAGIAPLPLKILRQLGYTTHIWFPNEALSFDELLTTVVGEGVLAHRAFHDQRDQADARLVSDYLAQPQADRPRFDYLVLDSTHYDYAYPPSFETYRPAGAFGLLVDPKTGQGLEKGNARDLRRSHEEPIQNKYRNSVLYVDTLVASLMRSRESTRKRPLFIFVFGDHGEAFWDKGGPFGHNTELSDAQTRVPLLACGPDGFSSRYQVSSHADLFPTLFDWMGITTRQPFMTGKSLAAYDPSRDYAIVRQPVTMLGASSQYQIVLPDIRVTYLHTEPLQLLSTRDADEQELHPVPLAATARALAIAISASTLQSPSPPR